MGRDSGFSICLQIPKKLFILRDESVGESISCENMSIPVAFWWWISINPRRSAKNWKKIYPTLTL